MKQSDRQNNRIVLAFEMLLTVALCFGMAYNSFAGLLAEASNYSAEVMADYNTLTNDYIRAFKILRMEAENEIRKDLSFDEMLAWLQSRDEIFLDAIGEGVYDGFAYTYKGGYAHSWNYGDYSQYDPNTRPWYQAAAAANGEIVVVAPYVTFLSNTNLIQKYDTLRMSIAQKYNEDISFDFDLDVKEINALIADRQTIYAGSRAFLYDINGYVLSSTEARYYGHNIGVPDAEVSQTLSKTLQGCAQDGGRVGLAGVDGSLRLVYARTNADGMTLCLLVSFAEIFRRNLLFVLLLAVLLLVIELMFYRRNKAHLLALEQGGTALRDALQQAESASRAKGDFMSRMSHEIRTPLNAVIGYLDIARDERTDEEKVTHCLEKAQVASRHLLSIINDVLDISSIESGRMKLAHEDFDLKQMVSALTTLFYAQAKAKAVNFEVHISGLESEWLVGDELRVRQILLNLLSNAVKFTPAGGEIHLNIKQVGLEQDRVHLEFQVQDSGIGMSREYMQRIFRPFEQESAATAKSYGGTGLGLSISNNLVHMMGGTIRVDSEQGKGTTFTVLLAFDHAQNEDHPASAAFQNLRALVVDDEEDTCEYVKKLMERCGVKCDTVTSGKKALRRIETRKASDHPYDMCILDWNMSGMDGLETSREIRRRCGQEMPIIIATAYDYSAIEEDAKAAGVSKIISKPLFQSTMFNLLVNTYGKYTPAAPKEKLHVDFHGVKLLLAEDNEMNMEIALDILRRAGLVITPVTDGKQALDTFTASAPGTFDGILMDIQMPVMDGYTATRQIRASNHPEAKTIPIIAMTANAFTEDVTAALAAGMNDHVAKPISYDRLFQVLSRLTGKKQAETAKNSTEV